MWHTTPDPKTTFGGFSCRLRHWKATNRSCKINGKCKIDAIDLSLKSLSFAKRKSKELKVENISFFQDDILNLPNQRKKYDLIACGGVLHHMEEPEKGLQILSDKLNNKGLLLIALYSTLARQNIKRVQNGSKRKN